ncbi:MAG: endonuclease Q family protein [Candidatus Thorarchaeota archaeon]
MQIFNADLHIHSPHSIAVSQSLNLETMAATCKQKGLHILGTGDILQPEWFKYMQQNLQKTSDGGYKYHDLFFLLQTEIEDKENIHHVVLFPDFDSVVKAQRKLDRYSKNLFNEWGGRPRVNLPPAELVDVITDIGGIIGPAHAFTPFKAIFRQNQYSNLNECYHDALKKVTFIELGLSANTDLADRLECLKDVSFLSNSDAHSQSPRSLGREFNRIDLDHPSFEEVELALWRKNSRKIILNVGLHPKLGKYYNMFCFKCRRRIIFKKTNESAHSIFNKYHITPQFVVYYSNDVNSARRNFIISVAKEKMICPACKEKLNKNYKIKLGVSERIEIIASYEESTHPSHRPPYINAIPLIDIIRSIKNIKSTTSKTVLSTYNKIISELGREYEILIDIPIAQIKNYNKSIGEIIDAMRNGKIIYTPGGGGTYGAIKLDLDA